MTTSEPHGLLLVHKDVGPSSFQVIGQLRKILGTRTIGHAGTLDPLAEGLLVVLVGQYTRLSNYLTAHDKRYVASVNFTGQTNTDDAEGETIASADWKGLTESAIRSGVSEFLGEQQQIPPMFSAIKVKGERLYKKARRGEDIELQGRFVQFFSLHMRAYHEPVALIDVHCSKGTYIRALARDLGAHLSVPAHLSGLVRTHSGEYDLQNAHRISELKMMDNPREALLRDVEHIRGISKFDVHRDDARSLGHGRSIRAPKDCHGEETYLACCEGIPIALVRHEEGFMRCMRGFNLFNSEP